jgi:transposase-like protein
MVRFAPVEIRRWLERYKEANAALLESDPEFRRWLDEEYVAIGGGWQY